MAPELVQRFTEQFIAEAGRAQQEAIYAKKVSVLEDALNNPIIRDEAAELLRTQIARIELRPRADQSGIDALLYGDLARILALCEEGGTQKRRPGTFVPGRVSSVVARPAATFVEHFWTG